MLSAVRIASLALLCACSGKSNPDSGAVGTTPDSGTPDAGIDPFALSVKAPGPLHTGHAMVEVDYVLPTGDSRSIPVHVWYPTDAEDGEQVRFDEGIGALDLEAVGDVDAAPAIHADGYPVLVHSHGSQGWAGNSSFLLNHLASHGFVVVAPDHIGNTLREDVRPTPAAHYLHRALDITASLDALADGAFAEVGLDSVDVSSVLLSGHSRGVYTAWASAGATFDPSVLAQSCDAGSPDRAFEEGCTADEQSAFLAGLGDPRVIATIPMAGSISRGTFFGETGHASVDVPVLSLSGTNDPVGADAQFASTADLDHTWVDITGACHETFGNGLCDTLDSETEGFVIVEAQVLAFARAHLLADTTQEVLDIVQGRDTFDGRVSWQSHTAR